jgi:RNA polymerase sigma factor (sigma-70 family)
MLEASLFGARGAGHSKYRMAVQAPGRAPLGRAPDRRLAVLAAAGDEAAFEAIFERHYRGLLSLCRHLLGSPEEAEDALQHTFAAAYRQLVERDAPKHLRAWLYTIARNRCLDVLRARRERPAELPRASTAGLSEEVEQRSDLRELVDDIGRLPEDQRAALVLSEVEELGHAEVAEVLGCRREKVRALVYQARASLSGWRDARALPCREVREELAVARGAALRRAHLRRHLNVCRECAVFREDMERQRRRVGLVLPVLPAIGLKERVLDAAWASAAAGGGGAAAGGATAGGGLAASLGSSAIKIGAAVLVLGGGAGAFVGTSGGESERRRPPAAPSGAHSVAHEFRQVTARRDRNRERASDRRRRSANASPGTARASSGSAASDQARQPAHGAAPAPEQAPAAPQPAPPAPQPAPSPQDRVGELPKVEVGAEVGAEVEVDPPAALP